MRILYLSYWNLFDPLTVSTVYPNLTLLCSFDWIEQIIFVNIERDASVGFNLEHDCKKLIYRPYLSQKRHGLFYQKFLDFSAGPRFIAALVRKHKIDAILSRGSPAGALAYLVTRKVNIPFYVESFEPHADYMLESKVWKCFDPRYLLEKYFESKQRKLSAGLMPVSVNYTNTLLEKGINPATVRTVPCAVNRDIFKFSMAKRDAKRHRLNIHLNTPVGTYVGKYGGLYLDEKAFHIYKMAFSFFKDDFFLILLTPAVYHEWIRSQIIAFQLPAEKVYIASVGHEKVADFLSASDFAFATYKPGKSKRYLSPIKIAEYWANGLPVLLTEGIGDENDIILKYPYAGVLFDPNRIEQLKDNYFGLLSECMSKRLEPDNPIYKLASVYRSPDRVKEAYEHFLMKGSQ